MLTSAAILSFLVGSSAAFPWVADVAGVDSSLLRSSRNKPRQNTQACPVNPNHQGAVPYNAKYPYCGARGSTVPGKFPCNKNQVPAPGDTAHAYQKPGPNDIRGPCPGINTAANHGFLSRDGITTYDELVEMQQNVYGVGYDLANVLATAGVALDGDVVTKKLSIGCDATPRTASVPTSQSGEYGLDGHQKFEADASLTRNDYFLANGDDYSFNKTLYDDMINNYCKGNCNLQAMSKYRAHRFAVSKATNGNFFHGPGSLLLYGAASFLYSLFPSAGNGVGDTATMNSFFINETLPANWFSRSDDYTVSKVGQQIGMMYQLNPVPFGANTGKPNSYVGFGSTGPYSDGQLGTPDGARCALYLLATNGIPATLVQNPMSPAAQTWALGQLTPFFNQANATGALSGCPFGPHEPGNPA